MSKQQLADCAVVTEADSTSPRCRTFVLSMNKYYT